MRRGASAMLGPQRDKAAEYRRLAEEGRALAMRVALPTARTQLLKAAQHWEELAEVVEQRQQLRVVQTNEVKSDR